MGGSLIPRVRSLLLAASLVAGDASAAGDEADPALEAALQLQTAFAQVAERVMPGVVGVTTWRRSEDAPPPTPGEGWRVASREGHPGYRRLGSASGTLVSEDGYLLTVNDLLVDGAGGAPADLVDVEVHGWGHTPARVVGAEPTLNLAVLKVELPTPLSPAPRGDSGGVAMGHWAIALGDPQGPARVFSAGSVSADPERECYQEDLTATLLQSSARVAAGGYGGPLVNIRGEIIGINLPAPDRGPVADAVDPHASYALPIELAMTLYEPLRAVESRRSPWIGISVRNVDLELRKRLVSPPSKGVYIDDVFDPSPAARVGLRVGDVLTKMGDEPIVFVSDFQRWLYLKGIGAPLRLEFSRNGERIVRELTIEERPPTAVQR